MFSLLGSTLSINHQSPATTMKKVMVMAQNTINNSHNFLNKTVHSCVTPLTSRGEGSIYVYRNFLVSSTSRSTYAFTYAQLYWTTVLQC